MNKLNEKQIEAITANNHFLVIIAGAGSGKTTVLTKRISYLYNKEKISPENILAITFTNKAAKEMKERLIKTDGPYAQMSWVLTFHAFAVRILRENAECLKYHNANFKIIDEDDKKKIIKNIINDNNLKDQFQLKDVLNKIAYAKTFAESLQEVEYKVDFSCLDIFKEYRSFCQENNLLDFDDLLLYAHDLLKKKMISEKYKKRFKYILVDEFQDTSKIQYDILKRLIDDDTYMFVVGDIDQSIYSWRGAVVSNMLNLSTNHRDVKIIKLEQNYRSNKEILKLANNLISYNEKRIDKNLWTEIEKNSAEIIYNEYNSSSVEAKEVVRKIDELLESGHKMEEIAVLYRSNYQSRKIEELLVKNHIPYIIYGGLRFYERMEIKDVLGYLRLIIDNNDIVALERIINTPKRKIGEKTIQKYKQFAKDNKLSVFEAITEIGNKQAKELIDIIKKYTKSIESDFEFNFDNMLEDIGYYHYLMQYDEASYDDRKANIAELKEGISYSLKTNTLQEYLIDLTLFSEKDDLESDKIILSTVHGVKGLEFQTVFIINLNQGKFPLARSLDSIDDLEEERRLGYVAITRAKENLYLSSNRFDFNGSFLEKSNFIKEMEIDEKEEDYFDFFV